MARTRIEIEEELNALKEVRSKVPTQTAFGDNNQEAIDAQIRVVTEQMDFEEVIDQFEVDGDYILSNALDAVRWLEDDDLPPSESWDELAVLTDGAIETGVAV